MENPDLPIAKIQLTFDKMSPELKEQIHIFFNILVVLMISTIIYIYICLIFKFVNKYFKRQRIYEEV
jgi:hypothetical protein